MTRRQAGGSHSTLQEGASSPAEHTEHHCVPSTTLYTDERLLHTIGRCPGGLRQEDDYIVKFQNSLGYRVKPCLKITKQDLMLSGASCEDHSYKPVPENIIYYWVSLCLLCGIIPIILVCSTYFTVYFVFLRHGFM